MCLKARVQAAALLRPARGEPAAESKPSAQERCLRSAPRAARCGYAGTWTGDGPRSRHRRLRIELDKHTVRGERFLPAVISYWLAGLSQGLLNPNAFWVKGTPHVPLLLPAVELTLTQGLLGVFKYGRFLWSAAIGRNEQDGQAWLGTEKGVGVGAAMSVIGFADLLQFEADRASQDHRSLKLVERLVPTFVVRWCASLVVRFLDARVRRMAATTFTFRGMAAAVEQQGLLEPIDPEDRLRTSLDHIDSDLRLIASECTDVVSKLRAADGRPRGPFRDAMERAGVVAEELRLEVRNLKGALQAHDASVYATRHARRAAGSVDELNRDFAQFEV